MNRLAESLPAFATTGALPEARTLARSIGTPLSEIGSGRPLTVSAELAAMRPADTDHRMQAALGQLGGRPPVLQTRTMFPNDGPIYTLVERVVWDCPRERLDEAAAVVAGAFRAAPAETLAAALVRLRMLTRGRDHRTADDHEAEYVVWIESLRCYPGDIVLDVLATWPMRKDGAFWPTWHDVQAELDKRRDRRMAIANWIRSAQAALTAPRKIAAPASEPEPYEVRAKAADSWRDGPLRANMAAHETTTVPETPEQALERLANECGVDLNTIPNAAQAWR